MQFTIFFLLSLPATYFCSLLNNLQIPYEHIDYFLYSNKNLKTKCENEKCLSEKKLNGNWCWGYEIGCHNSNSFSKVKCDGDPKGWASSLSKQIDMFYKQTDFGYIQEFRNNLEPLCQRENEGDSFLACTQNLEFCKGNSIAIDFEALLKRLEPVRYHMDVLKNGEITGKCRLNTNKLAKSLSYMSPLQSWAPELRFFKEKNNITCDLWIEKPTIIIKLDASVSMYHHFCDFFNLYASQHLNSSDPFDFQTDTQILIWETYPYRANFAVAWKAFSKNPLWNLNDVKGKKVCFKNVMFPLLARGIFGLYYNTPIVPGCEGSGLYRAFSQHFLHRMGVQKSKRDNRIHITFLSRSTKYRRINNERELIETLAKYPEFVVKKVEFSHSTPFLEQLAQDQWTDILVGIHGSGLTHSLFLPDWSVVFEIYNCDDPNCYRDLARTRGLHYITWENKEKLIRHDDVRHPEYSNHEKYRNYSFDKDEFMRLIKKSEKLVKTHPEYQKFHLKHQLDEL